MENLDVMLGNYQRDNSETQNENDEGETASGSIRREERPNQNENDYRSYLNTNLSENTCLAVKTSKTVTSEISSQMSRKLEEMQSCLNSQILDVINTAIETRVFPCIKNVVERQNSARNVNLDLRSDGPHRGSVAQENSQKDLRSNRLHAKKQIN